MRAFIFSLDAFVAFTLALVAIYSLIFFSSVPSSFYYLLTQGHFLSRDVLLSLSTTTCTDDYGVCKADGTLLDNIVSQDNPAFQKNLIQNTVGNMVPDQFGYRLDISSDHGSSWNLLYDTATEPGESHATKSKKLTISSQVITFGYSGKINKLQNSPYNYLTCQGDGVKGMETNASSEDFIDWGIITCGIVQIVDGNTTQDVNLGNTHPSNVLGGDLVPSSDVKVVRFTVFI